MARIFGWSAERPLPGEVTAELKQILDSGGIVVYPAGTLYGLGASIGSSLGLKNLNDIKSRPAGMPMSIMATAEQMGGFCRIPKQARRFIDAGESRITMVLPAGESAPSAVVHEGTVGVRLPCSELTRSLVGSVGPITATSANLHGAAPPVEVRSAVAQLGERVSMYIDAGRQGGVPSTIVDFTGPSPKIIREGALSSREVVRE